GRAVRRCPHGLGPARAGSDRCRRPHRLGMLGVCAHGRELDQLPDAARGRPDWYTVRHGGFAGEHQADVADPLPPDFTGLQITSDVIVSVIIGEPHWKPMMTDTMTSLVI